MRMYPVLVSVRFSIRLLACLGSDRFEDERTMDKSPDDWQDTKKSALGDRPATVVSDGQDCVWKPDPTEASDAVAAAKDQINQKIEKESTRPPLQVPQDDRRPGAYHEGGDDDDDFEDSVLVSDDPVTAELVDMDVEKQLVQEQVNISLQRERAKAPVAEVVPERCCDRRRTVIAVIVLALIAIIAIVLGVTLPKDKGPPPAPVPSEEDVIMTLSAVSSDGGEALQTPGRPQNEALHWLANDTYQGYHTDEKLIQRYALATLFYSTNGRNWYNKSSWLDNGDECGRWWQPVGKIVCDQPTGAVKSLGLGGNNLKGTVPPEIGLLSSLLSLGLSSNTLTSTIPSEIGALVRGHHVMIQYSVRLRATLLSHFLAPTTDIAGRFESQNL